MLVTHPYVIGAGVAAICLIGIVYANHVYTPFFQARARARVRVRVRVRVTVRCRVKVRVRVRVRVSQPRVHALLPGLRAGLLAPRRGREADGHLLLQPGLRDRHP